MRIDVLRLVYVANMVALDPVRALPGRKPCERDEKVRRQHHDVPEAVKERCMTIICARLGHQQRRLRVDGPMKAEDGG